MTLAPHRSGNLVPLALQPSPCLSVRRGHAPLSLSPASPVRLLPSPVSPFARRVLSVRQYKWRHVHVCAAFRHSWKAVKIRKARNRRHAIVYTRRRHAIVYTRRVDRSVQTSTKSQFKRRRRHLRWNKIKGARNVDLSDWFPCIRIAHLFSCRQPCRRRLYKEQQSTQPFRRLTIQNGNLHLHKV